MVNFGLADDGFIDVYEYLDVMKSNFNTLDIEKERLMTAFRVIDKKGDGRILKKDFINILTCNNSCITREEADKMFTEADSLGKGYIGYEGRHGSYITLHDISMLNASSPCAEPIFTSVTMLNIIYVTFVIL